MYPTNYLGSMTLCKEISLISQIQTGYWNHEECLPQEYMECGGDASARGDSTNPPDINQARLFQRKLILTSMSLIWPCSIMST